MSLYNQRRATVIQIIFGCVFIVIFLQLLNLQIFSTKYKIEAANNAIYAKRIYPARGIIYDRNKKPLLENTTMYDLILTPSELKNIDTATLCTLLGIDTLTFEKRVAELAIRNGRVKPSVFEPLLSPELFAKLNENMYKFPGFSLSERSVRTYPYSVAAHLLGYIAEVDTSFLRRHATEGYEMGDYSGMTGLERTYERVLMGRRGVKRYIRDNRSRIQGSYENGAFDTIALSGKNLYSSIDVKLQQLGEKLMTNKVGSIVALDPTTGGILCLVSAPTYDPNNLTGNQRRKHFSEMYTDPRLPLLNRAVGTKYSPGSTFKTLVGMIGMSEGAINDKTLVSCGGAYYGCGRRMGCHASGTFNISSAISKSCNSFFAVTFRRIIDLDKFPTHDSALNRFNDYAFSFGLGNRLGIDIPSEQKGNIPIPKIYHKIFGPRWQSCNIISNAIGQGEIQTSLIQLVNAMAIIANKGWYYTPHLIDSIEGGEETEMLQKFTIKHQTEHIDDSIFERVHDGMQGTMEFGTGEAAKVPGIAVCGKTGTVENAYHGEKQKDHAFFGAFAPRRNPKIAIAVMCENAGFGATSAAPIASLMIEQYLKNEIPEKDRQDLVESIAKRNLIPKRMRDALARMDSIRNAILNPKDSGKLSQETGDTLDVEERPIETIPQKDNKRIEEPPKDKPKKENTPPSHELDSAAIESEKKKQY